MKFRLNMASIEMGVEEYYREGFKRRGWGQTLLFELDAKRVFDKGNVSTSTINIKHGDSSFLVYIKDLMPTEFKPLKDYM